MKRSAVVILGVLLLGAAVAASLAVGSRDIPLNDVVSALLRPSDGEHTVIVRELRLPRTLVGLQVGVALAVAGVIMQTLTRNPIAEPRILGIAAGASFGVVVAIAVFGLSTLAGWIWFGLGGAALAGVAVFSIAARTREGSAPVNLALTGAAIDAGLGALIYGVLSIDAATFDQFRFWVVGSLAGRTPQMALQVLPFLALGLVFAAMAARGLDALALGDDMARGLGHSVARWRAIAAAAAILLTGAAVAVAGPIAFVGLAVPHAARALVGTNHRWTLPVSALLGAILVLGADVLGRVLFPPGEVPAGVITALAGAPVLLWVVLRK
ncbi:iron ABC transporter permease [Rhizocola hellebori]|uniref:Iron ABC transporter permease n=1 Tax=Rhizocola hellebori TaxID=1392758 RepID=A0A8J3Q2B1_9ACTN|nr:iron ABC transporter permease [Rhizocola hellebori]GIH02060.1 iron ABC transporter permease [Rhizocola hellebori]